MTFRRSSKLVAIVGFLISLSTVALLYGNLSSVSEERDEILERRNTLERELEQIKQESIAKKEEYEGKLKQIESAVSACQKVKSALEDRNTGIQSTVNFYKGQAEEHERTMEGLRKGHEEALAVQKREHDAALESLKSELVDLKGSREEADSCRTSLGEVQGDLVQARSTITRLEGKVMTCAKDLERLGAAGDGAESEAEAEPVKEQGVPVADIPEQPDNKKQHVIGNQEIHEALVPAPGALAAAPVHEAVKHDAVGAMPPNKEEEKAQPVLDNNVAMQPPPAALAQRLMDQGGLNVVHGGDISEDELSDSGGSAGDDDDDNDTDAAAAGQPEIQPAQPAPNFDHQLR